MDEFMEMDDGRQAIKQKLRQYFDGKIVRKDLTKHIKEVMFRCMCWSFFWDSIAAPMMMTSSKKA